MKLDYIYSETESIERMSSIVDLHFDKMMLVINRFPKNCIVSLTKDKLNTDIYTDKLANYTDLGIIRIDNKYKKSIVIASNDDLTISLFTNTNKEKKYNSFLISSICKYLRSKDLDVFTNNDRIRIRKEGIVKSLGTAIRSKTTDGLTSHIYVLRFTSKNDLVNDLLINNYSPCMCVKGETVDNTVCLNDYDINFTQEEFSLGVATILAKRIGYELNQREFDDSEIENINNLTSLRDTDNWRYNASI